MLTTVIERRKYKMSDADLIQLTDSIQDSADRDSVALAQFGVDAGTLTALGTARNTFANGLSDHYLSAKMVIATQNKNAKKEVIQLAIKKISDRAKIKYGDQDGRYKLFGVSMISKQSDNDLYRMAKLVIIAGTEQLADLASEGLTEQMITDLETANNEFDILIDLKNRAVRNRDAAVDERIKQGNEVYALLTNLAAKGKLCWEDNNEALYNDYVLYPSGSSNTADISTGIVDGNSTVNISISGNDGSTNYTLKNTGDQVLTFYFATEPTDSFGPVSVTVGPQSELVSTATNLGYNEAENRLRLNVNNSNAASSSYEVRWE